MHELSHQGKLTALLIHDDTIQEEANFLMTAMREAATHGKGKFLANFSFGCLAAKGYQEFLEKHSIQATEFPLFLVANAPWGTFYRNATVEAGMREAANARWSARFVGDLVEYLGNIESGHEREQVDQLCFNAV